MASQYVVKIATPGQDNRDSFWRHFPRTVHGVTLVAGGVIIVVSPISPSVALTAETRSLQDFHMNLWAGHGM